MSPTQIHLPKPCHENWNAMTAEEKGRFCQSCHKTVYDFTKSSDRQIIAHLDAHPKTCGRFLASQLDRNLVIPQQKNTFWTATFAGFISLFVFESQHASAQTKQQSVHTYRAKYNREPVLQKKGEVQIKTDSILTICGVVVESGLPIPAAKITIKGEQTQTESDFDGHFAIEATHGDTLLVSFIGYRDSEILLTQSDDQLVVELEPSRFLMGDVGYATFTYINGDEKPSFVRRQWWRVRNWFR